MSDSPAPRRLQFGLGTMLLGMTFIAPWFLLYTYARQRRPDLANNLFLGVIGFALFMVVIVIICRYAAPRIKPIRDLPRAPPPTNPLSWASYFLGLISLITAVISLSGAALSLEWILLCGLTAVACGSVALWQSRHKERGGDHFFSYIGLTLGTVFGVLVPLAYHVVDTFF